MWFRYSRHGRIFCVTRNQLYKVTVDSDEAVAEWTHWRTKDGTYLRGDEWYVFDRDSGLITEIRAYFAAAWDPSLEKSEIPGFDYAGRDYPLTPPD